MTPEQERTIDKIATYFAMEEDMDAKIVRNYCVTLCTTDRRTLQGISLFGGMQNVPPNRPNGNWLGIDNARYSFVHACQDHEAAHPPAQLLHGDHQWKDYCFFQYAHNTLVKRLKRERLLR